MMNQTTRCSITKSGRFIPMNEPISIVQEAGWAPEPVWTGTDNLAPRGFEPQTVQPVASPYTDYALST